jgi:hypothetical protein
VSERVIDAYRYPQRLVEGCQHRLGCKCDPPFWLRPYSPAELERLKREEAKHSTAGEKP